MTKHESKRKEKMCNLCGEMVLNYTVIDNAPICNDCAPCPKKYKKILKEKSK